jgi:hypothetical protein
MGMLTTSFSIIMHLIFDENKIFVFKFLIDFNFFKHGFENIKGLYLKKTVLTIKQHAFVKTINRCINKKKNRV